MEFGISVKVVLLVLERPEWTQQAGLSVPPGVPRFDLTDVLTCAEPKAPAGLTACSSPAQPLLHWASDHIHCVASTPPRASQCHQPNSHSSQAPLPSPFPPLCPPQAPVTPALSVHTLAGGHPSLLFFPPGNNLCPRSLHRHLPHQSGLSYNVTSWEGTSWWPKLKQSHHPHGVVCGFISLTALTSSWNYLFTNLSISPNEHISSTRAGMLSWPPVTPQVLEQCLAQSKSQEILNGVNENDTPDTPLQRRLWSQVPLHSEWHCHPSFRAARNLKSFMVSRPSLSKPAPSLTWFPSHHSLVPSTPTYGHLPWSKLSTAPAQTSTMALKGHLVYSTLASTVARKVFKILQWGPIALEIKTETLNSAAFPGSPCTCSLPPTTRPCLSTPCPLSALAPGTPSPPFLLLNSSSTSNSTKTPSKKLPDLQEKVSSFQKSTIYFFPTLTSFNFTFVLWFSD